MNAATVAARGWFARIAGRLHWRMLADAYTQGVDNFLLLRFVAASMVIYTHSHALSGMRKVDIFVHAGWDTNAGGIAVDMFFCISGFLVTGSFMRWPT